jgi:hypothetical protein
MPASTVEGIDPKVLRLLILPLARLSGFLQAQCRPLEQMRCLLLPAFYRNAHTDCKANFFDTLSSNRGSSSHVLQNENINIQLIYLDQ